MSKSQSIKRAVQRGNIKILHNPDSNKFEKYTRNKNSGLYVMGAKEISLHQIQKLEYLYEKRAEQLKEEAEAERLKEIQERARNLEV